MFSQGTVADDLEGKEVVEAVAVDNTGGGWNKRLDGAKFGGSSETSMQLFLLLSRTYNIDKENCKIFFLLIVFKWFYKVCVGFQGGLNNTDFSGVA